VLDACVCDGVCYLCEICVRCVCDSVCGVMRV